MSSVGLTPTDSPTTASLLERVQEYARTVLAPTAVATDTAGVTAGRVGELAGLGLLNHLAPRWAGGAAADRQTDRRIHELLAGACFNTWLVWAQHAPIVGRLAAVDGDRTNGDLSPAARSILAGEVLAGAGLSDVRRYPQRYIRARPVPGGWALSGTLSWVSGWGLNSVLAVGAVDPDTATVLTTLVPVSDRTRAEHLELAALTGSRTLRVRLDEAFVADEDVIARQPLSQWRTTDLGTAGDARGQHFGLAEAILAELEQSPHAAAQDVAVHWRPRVDGLRAQAYGLADEALDGGDPLHRIDERLATKAASGEALSTLSRALLISRSGRGLARDDTAQLYARNALFVLVQGQRTEVRDAQLALLAR
ncbi:acyl-CoA dehydrogenase [Gordonia sp. VNK21]|uniref:acyl-CoA dehydrogenase n=1 Tax=Gordonia sp. VNK21 TaxID=3382483 RepID=UPI0038D392AC